MHKTDEKHIFAVYIADIFARQKIDVGISVAISDEQVVHRVVTVLRMQIDDELVLFDDAHHYQITITDIKKNKVITLIVTAITPNPKPLLQIDFLLPLLKKEALEEAVYSLTEIGVSRISLVITTKSQKQLTDKELIRLHKVKISAAEQSKNFAMPEIIKPFMWEKLGNPLAAQSNPGLLFDPSGKAALELLTHLHEQKIKNIACLIGPEAGLTIVEIQQAIEWGFVPCKLTATVLRAVQAAAVGAGLVASLL